MSKKRKQYLWLPYLAKIKNGRQEVKFSYKGGDLKIAWQNIHAIMIYGHTVPLDQDFLERCAFWKIPVVIHRRNMPRAVFITPTLAPDQNNILVKQILFRESAKKRAYLARRLLLAKFKSMAWLYPIPYNPFYRVTSLEKMVNFEAWHAKQYWQLFYKKLGVNSWRRQKDNIITSSLDAVSKFLAAIFLRWVLYHGLSPFHGFIHQPSDYPALIYDLMEPYRGYFDKVVFDTLKEEDLLGEKKEVAIGAVINRLKEFLDEKAYVNATRQVVTFNEIIHGEVLALRSYLLGEVPRFVVPLPGRPNGGRPIKAGYKLYGHKAGITNFWPETREIADKFCTRMASTNP